MRISAVVSIAVLLTACAKTESSTPADTAAMAPMPEPAAEPAAVPISLPSVAGKYRVTSRGQSGDTTVTTYELNATGDTTGWTITFPNRKPVPMRIISVSGDSIVAESGEFQSVRRAGVPVTTRTTYRLQNGQLVGTTVARYKVSGSDTMRVFVIEGVKK